MAEHCREATVDISQTRQCLVEPAQITSPERTAEILWNLLQRAPFHRPFRTGWGWGCTRHIVPG